MYTIKILTEVDAIKWNNDLMKSEFANFFESAEFLTSESSKDRFPIFIYVFDENGVAVGQLGLMIVQRIAIDASPFFRRFSSIASKISSRGDCTCGPIIHTTNKTERMEILQNIIKTLDLIAQKYDLVYIDCRTSHLDNAIDEEYKSEFKKNNYRIIDCVTFIDDLTRKIEEIWKDVSKKARGDVTRARRRNIIVKELNSYEDLKEFLLLFQKWNESIGSEVKDPFQNIEKLWNLHKSGIRKFFLAYQNDRLISAMSIGCFNKIAYTDFVINSYEKDTNLGGTLLTWNALEWAKNAGFRIYDFTGGPYVKSNNSMKLEDDDNLQDAKNETKSFLPSAGINKAGLLFYKKKWGGNPYYYFELLKIRKKYTYKLYKMLLPLLFFYKNFKTKRPKRVL